jgi:hypothetical protein
MGCVHGLESGKFCQTERSHKSERAHRKSPYTIGVGRIGPNNRLHDDAAAKGATAEVGINGSRGLRFGSVGRDGEERREGIHCGVCGAGVEL